MSELSVQIDAAEREEIRRLVTSSVALIRELQDVSGAYPASPTFSAYRGYCWFRDGAFIADGMSAAGDIESANRFFDWCTSILESRESAITSIVDAANAGRPVPDEQMLPTRFTLAGEDGDDGWWDFQLDGYGTWLWAVSEHSRRHGVAVDRWLRAIELTVRYLASSWSRPCFDWWEENPREIHVSTLGCIAAGMESVQDLKELDAEHAGMAEKTAAAATRLILDRGHANGHLSKWLGVDTSDASLAALIAPLGVIDATSALGLSTIKTIDEQLNVDGGVHRYLADTFFGGGQWPLLSCMLGLAFAAAELPDLALHQLRWAAGTVNQHDHMPEQVATHLLDASMQQEWVERWGPSANPLLWSHAMYVRLAVELGLVEGGGQ